MTWEQALTPTLEQTLNLILSALANFFGTTTQAIMEKAPEWLAKYGWYVTLHNELGGQLMLGLFLGVVLGAIFLFIWNCVAEKEIKAGAIVIAFFIVLITLIAFAVVTILPCILAPEIVGLEAAIKLIS